MVPKHRRRTIKWSCIFRFKNGIKGMALCWLRSYLSDRIQYCQVNGHLSDPLTVKTGIPQGSGLGPLLFLIYINDFPKCLRHTRPDMFADDTQIATSNSDINVIYLRES